MPRETDKHNPRVDDAMAHDVESLTRGAPVESRAQEARLQEDPEVGPGRRADVEPPPGALSEAEADERAELSRHLATARFPAGRDELIAAAEGQGAPDPVLQDLRALPGGQAYPTVQAVWEALGGRTEDRHT